MAASDKKDQVDAWEKLGISPTGISQVPGILDIIWMMKHRLTVCLVGETGIGKTPIVHQWCAARNGYMQVLNFGHMTQEEISMIMFSEKGDQFGFVPPSWLLRLNKEAEERGAAVLFLDEWNRGDKALVNALFTLTDERRIHDFHLNENVMVVAAMNPSDGSYLVNEAEKDHAIRKRLNFVYTVHDLSGWLDYTKKSAWHPLVPAFIKSAPNFLYDSGARDAGKAFPCPSNWEKVSRLLEAGEALKTDLASSAMKTLVEGQIGSVAAKKFMDFVADQNTLIQPSEIVNDYTPQSAVRRRVAGLLGMRVPPKGSQSSELVPDSRSTGNRASILSELCEGVAYELFSSQPEPSKVAPHIARFIGDLPNELLSQFTAQHLQGAAQAKGEEGAKYMSKLSSALGAYPEYKAKIKDIIKAMHDYKKKAGMIKGSNPQS